jgi:hypothetical protein
MVKRRLAKEWKCKTGRDTRKSDRGARSSGVVWPPLAELRATFVAKYGSQDWLCNDEEWQAPNVI